jgi:uncharacterized protein involved in exopolysaccharide biosynthesis
MTPHHATHEPLSGNAEVQPDPNWATNVGKLLDHRVLLARVAIISLIVSAIIAFALPKQYESTARIIPPDNSNPGTAVLAALAGKSTGGLAGLGSIAGSLLGGRSSSVLFAELLQSRSVSDHIIDRFQLQHVYRKRYRVDTVKYLAKRTVIAEDKKSGVLTLTVTDTDPERSRAIAQAYLDELNTIVVRSNTSSARREREFIEQRLVSARSELQDAQVALSAFSSSNATLDIKEQTHAMVEAASRLQAQKIFAESELASLSQIYGDDNVRVRAARARIADLQRELTKMSGTASDAALDSPTNGDGYPSLRQLPRLAVPYANLYRRVRIQETVYELLSQQYEMARIAEAKDTPIVSVIDAPLLPEKKSFPPRLILIIALTGVSLLTASAYILIREYWLLLDPSDPKRRIANRILSIVERRLHRREAAL